MDSSDDQGSHNLAMTFPAFALLFLALAVAAPFALAAEQDRREKRRRDREQALHEYGDLLGRDE